MEILSPINPSVLPWDKHSENQPVDHFDLSMNMSSVNGQENGDGYMSVDQTFHTPSFGDEEFDIPPISLPPTSSSDSNPNDLYGNSQPLSHQQQPQQSNQHIPQQHSPQQQQQQQPQQQQQQQPQQQQQALPPCSQSMGMGDPSGVMTSVASTPSPTMSIMDGGPPPQQYSGPPMHAGPTHHDMYMVQIGPGTMLPPQSVQFQMQQYNVPTSYASSPMQQQQQHMQHPQQHLHHQQPQHHMGMQHPLQHQFHHSPQPQQHHQQQQQHHPQLLPPSSILALQLGAPRVPRPGSVGSSPPGSNQTSPGLETSEDSDDSGHLSQLMGGIKRPSPEPNERPPSGGKPIKKPKVQKKKKKRDPNEPQKPVSAYALFFRDTQAAIKGQNPNASFGEVSKIVASMWDSLDIEHKNIYKKKTEAAKKEYLKALAAYRASLVSKAANDQSDNIYGNGSGVSTTSASNGSVAQNQQLSPLQKKSPLLTSLMEGTPISTLQNMTQPQPLLVGQAAMGGGSNLVHHHQQQHMIPQHMSHPGQPPPQMFNHMAPNGHMMPSMAIRPPPLGSQMMTLNHSHQGQPGGLNTNHSYSPNMMPSSPQMSHPGQSIAHGGGGMLGPSQMQNCLRNSGSNEGQEWDGQEYCSNNCVVSHCRDVYTTWVSSRQTPNSYASVK